MLEAKKRNNFDAVRVFLAASVMLSHMMVILPANYGPLKIFTNHLDGSRAVECFFVISGFLIFRSYRSSNSVWQYAVKRARRIYPGLLAVIVACALLGMAITELPLADYLSMQTLNYVFYNLAFMTFVQPNLPGVFAHNDLSYVNGPLWTLKIEVMFYVAVPMFYVFSRRFMRFEILAIVVYAASVAFWTLNQHFAAHSSHARLFAQIAHQLPGQLSFFMAGALLEHRLDSFRRYSTVLVPLAVALLVVYSFVDIYPLYPAAIAIVVIYVCVLFPVYFPAAKYGDLSYGLYIVHFPIIQTFAALAILEDHPGLRAVAVLSACLSAAALSWHVVEKRWLHATSRQRARGDAIPSAPAAYRSAGIGSAEVTPVADAEGSAPAGL